MVPVFVGIDVACANGKRLPICFAQWERDRLTPLKIPTPLARAIPRGIGNGAVQDAAPFAELAAAVTAAIENILREMKWTIARVAIDAPASPGLLGPRQCEAALTKAGLSVFKTPNVSQWPDILFKCRQHLAGAGSLARLPHANMIWMRYGFELFSAFRRNGWKPIEVYPFAIAHTLLQRHPHKSTDEGYGMQAGAIAERTGWSSSELEAQLRQTVPGSRHDKLDAFMAAWVASLPKDEVTVYGNRDDLDDAIWVPLLVNSVNTVN